MLFRSVEVLNAGTPPPHNQALALIAAGTGLGEAILFWNGFRYQPMPSEGGHSDFAPNNDNEIGLLHHLRGHYMHVSYERVLSGPGLMPSMTMFVTAGRMSPPGSQSKSKLVIRRR